jgi:hypothetical protein
MATLRKNTIYLILFFFVLAVPHLAHADDSNISQANKPLLQIKENSFDLGIVAKGAEFGYQFLFENRGQGDLIFLRASPRSPGEIQVRMPSIIPAGEEHFVHISQDSNQIQGAHTLKVLIQTNDPNQPEVLLSLSGYVQWPVEILPRPWALMKVQKGQSSKQQFTLVNNTQTPLEFKKIELDENLFEIRIIELEKGKRFEITVSSRSDAPLGEHRKRIVFHTNVSESPQVYMGAWLKVRERIYTNLQELDFGERPLTELFDPKIVELTNEIVIINGMSTPGFKVLEVECDIDFLVAELHPVAKNNVHRVDVYFQPEKAQKGTFQGSLTILTNDREFKRIVLPVRGKLY